MSINGLNSDFYQNKVTHWAQYAAIWGVIYKDEDLPSPKIMYYVWDNGNICFQ